LSVVMFGPINVDYDAYRDKMSEHGGKEQVQDRISNVGHGIRQMFRYGFKAYQVISCKNRHHKEKE